MNIANESFDLITNQEKCLQKDIDLDMELLKKLFLTETLQRKLSICKNDEKDELNKEVKEVDKEVKDNQNSNNNLITIQLDNREEDTELVKRYKSILKTIVDFLKQFFYKWIDKTLLIDLVISHKQKISGFFDIMIYSFYSNIEFFLLLAFIFNNIHDASILSCVYPLTYFGYGLIEYPFPSKVYWRLLIIYDLFVITIKLIYQFPLFCGYPFLSMFNVLFDLIRSSMTTSVKYTI